MKLKWMAVTGMMLLAACSAGEKGEHEASEVAPALTLDGESAKFSYAIGMDIANSVKRMPEPVDQQALIAGIDAALNGKEMLLSAEEAAGIKQSVFKRQQEAMVAKRKAAGEKNKAEGEKFLAENAKKDGIKVTDSGLQYEVLRKGDGAMPKATDKVKVNYRGTLLDGTEFDSSYKRGEPITFPLNQVIAGWTEAVQLMSVGSKYRLFIPSDLAYGPNGAGDRIGPNSTLIFEVELLGIEK